MKNTTLTSRTLLGLAIMGALAAAPTMTRAARADAPAVAARADRNFDRDDNDGAHDDESRFNNGQRADADERGRGGRRDDAEFGRRDDKGPRVSRDSKNGRAEFGRHGDDRDRAEFEGRAKRRGRADFGGRGRNRNGDNALGRGGVGRPSGDLMIAPQFVGVVSKVKSDSEFDIRIGDKIYNVYLAALHNRIRVGQTVGLNGERIGNNDIRSASLLPARRR